MPTGRTRAPDVGILVLALSLVAGAARAQDADAEKALLQTDSTFDSAIPSPAAALEAWVEAYQSAWNTHDAAAVAGFFAQDADMVMGNLPATGGRQAIQEWWGAYFARLEPERRLTLDVAARLLAPGVGLVDVVTTTGGLDAQGRELPARRFRGTWIVGRQTGEWLIAALRAFPTEDDHVVLKPSADPAEALTHQTPQGPPDLRAFVGAYADAFNRHNPSAVTAFYTDDADIVVRTGPYTRGRQAIEESWRAYFSEPRPYTAMLVIDSVRTMTPDVAVINVVATGAPRKGQVQEPSATHSRSMPRDARYARATWVVVRHAGEWQIAALRVLPSEDDQVIRTSSR